MNKRQLGTEKESLAAEYLEEQRIRVLDRNFRTRFGEIDLVARDGDEFVFVEVKYRAGTNSGDPAEAVGTKKQAVIRKTALTYLKSKGVNPTETLIRFDVVSILGKTIRHYKNAF